MRNLVFISAILGLTSAGVVCADDVSPDQAIKLMQAGKIKPFEKLNKAALAKHPGATVEETDLEKEYGGYIYKIELRDAQGIPWEMDLDAVSGKLIRNQQDD